VPVYSVHCSLYLTTATGRQLRACLVVNVYYNIFYWQRRWVNDGECSNEPDTSRTVLPFSTPGQRVMHSAVHLINIPPTCSPHQSIARFLTQTGRSLGRANVWHRICRSKRHSTLSGFCSLTLGDLTATPASTHWHSRYIKYRTGIHINSTVTSISERHNCITVYLMTSTLNVVHSVIYITAQFHSSLCTALRQVSSHAVSTGFNILHDSIISQEWRKKNKTIRSHHCLPSLSPFHKTNSLALVNFNYPDAAIN